jgi:oleandomycin transport system ATP-binding protein
VTDGLVTVPVTDTSVVPEVLRRLDAEGVPLLELSIRQPGLDEVFRQLTTAQGAAA